MNANFDSHAKNEAEWAQHTTFKNRETFLGQAAGTKLEETKKSAKPANNRFTIFSLRRVSWGSRRDASFEYWNTFFGLFWAKKPNGTCSDVRGHSLTGWDAFYIGHFCDDVSWKA